MKNNTPFRPSVIERPVLRLQFTTPQGETHQSTITSSWPGGQGYPADDLAGVNTAAVEFRRSITEALQRLCQTCDCVLSQVELVGCNTREFGA